MARHEQQLEQRVKDLQADLDRDRQERSRIRTQSKEFTAFMKLPAYTRKMEFWCDRCSIDFVAPGYKSFSKVHQTGSWHSFCPMCEGIVYRHITSKRLDPYYARSAKVRIMRGEAHRELLQPGQHGFRMTYGDPFENYYRRFQAQQEQIFNKYASMGLVGRTLNQKTEEEEVTEWMNQ